MVSSVSIPFSRDSIPPLICLQHFFAIIVTGSHLTVSKGVSDIALKVRYKACPAEVVQRQMEELCPEVSPLRRESLSRRIREVMSY